MKTIVQLAIALACGASCAAQAVIDYAHIDVFITPYYNSNGGVVSIGHFSEGLASKDEAKLVATISEMKRSWDKLSFTELYVAAIRLYDCGYRKESVYWYYTAQYRGRLFGALIDEEKMGGPGDLGFELVQAQNAFVELVGPYITGYAFTDFDFFAATVERVKREGATIPDVKATYRGIAFKSKKDWKAANAELNSGMSQLLGAFKEQRKSIREARIAQGTEAQFSSLQNKELTSR